MLAAATFSFLPVHDVRGEPAVVPPDAPQAAGQQSGSKFSRTKAPAVRLPAMKNERDLWLTISLGEYLQWRERQRSEPEGAREEVQRALLETQSDALRQPLARMSKRCAWVETQGCQRARRHGVLAWRTLETVIDRARVDRAMAEFPKRFAGRKATPEDFRKICEEISGRDLRWFFNYYLHGSELPEITLRRIAGTAPNEVAGEIVLNNAPPEYQVRVEMRLYTAAGVINHSVATSGAVTPFTVTSNDAVIRMVMDPDWRILRRTAVAER